jgi:CRISPR-associated protein Cas1
MLLSIDDKANQLLIRKNRLAIKSNSHVLRYFPIDELSELHIDKNCLIEVSLLENLINNKVDLIFDTCKADPIFVGANQTSSYLIRLKLACFSLYHNEDIRLAMAMLIVKAKLKRQVQTLVNMSALLSVLHLDVESAISKCRIFTHKLNLVEQEDNNTVITHQTLLGFEGIVAKHYFSALQHFIPKWAGFTKRVKRPATDPANALMSLTYVMFTKHITRNLIIKGFDPSLGVLHKPCDYRPSLACDVMEWFRPQLDSWLIVLLKTSMKPEYFNPPDEQTGAVYLNNVGKKAFYPAWHVLKHRLTPQLNRLLNHLRYKILVASKNKENI